MVPRLVEAKHLGGYRLWLRFQDGTQGEIDLSSELWGEIFEPIKDVNRFVEFQVDPDLNTLTWPNGADFSPEYLYKQVSE